MKIEVRNEKVILDGYINAVERFSKPLRDRNGTFIEKIMPNVFAKALSRKKNIPVLLDHNEDRVLANTEDGTAKLYEDNIGLRGIVEISDPEVIEKAKKGLLRGWSFGFHCLDDEKKKGDKMEERIIHDLDLSEVSIIDDKKIPVYNATSIEMRSDEENKFIEYRSGKFDATVIRKEELEQQFCLSDYRNRIINLIEKGGDVNEKVDRGTK